MSRKRRIGLLTLLTLLCTLQFNAQTTWENLLDENLTKWELWMGVPHVTTGLPGATSTDGRTGTPLGLGNDPLNVFSVIDQNGELQLKITGEVYGGLTTLKEYADYHFSVEFKWGEAKYEPRLNRKRDSGILYHCKGKHGAFWNVWKSCLEFQVQEEDCGDYFGLAGGSAKIQSENGFFSPGGSLSSAGRIRRSQNFENPNGQWNTLEVLTVGDRSMHFVNGNLVNALENTTYKGAVLVNGQIQIQSEGAEVYYRNMRIRSINDFPQAEKALLGWDDTPPVANAPIGKVITLQKSGGDAKYIAVDAANGNQLIASTTADNAEKFIVEAHPNGGIALKSETTGKYVQVKGNSTTQPVYAFGNAPGTWERFEWKSKGEGKVALQSLFTNKWIQASYQTPNAILYPFGAADGTWETFNFKIEEEISSVPIGKVVTLQKSGGDAKYVAVSTTNGDQLIANTTADNAEKFAVEAHPNGGIALKSETTGKYVQVKGNSTTQPVYAVGNAPGTWERFEWKSKGEGQVALQSLFTNKWIQASHATSNSVLYPSGAADGLEETFNFRVNENTGNPPSIKGRVLVFHKTNGFTHSSIDDGINMIRRAGQQNGFWETDDTKDSGVFTPENLKRYDVVIWCNTTGNNLLNDTQEAAFEEYIRNGGGFVGIHSATDTYRNREWPFYNDLVGAIVQTNPYHTNKNYVATMTIDNASHPTVEFLGGTWKKREEYYYWKKNGGQLFSGNNNLLIVEATGNNDFDEARPIAWYKTFQGGRSFYTALGHHDEDYTDDSLFIRHITEGIIWAGSFEEQTSVRIEAEDFNEQFGIKTEPSSEGTDNVGWIQNNDWLKFNGIDLNGIKSFSARVACAYTGGDIEVRLGSPTGDLVGNVSVVNTGGNQLYKTVSADLTNVSGQQDVYFVFKGGSGYLFNVNWFELLKTSSDKVLTFADNESQPEILLYPNPSNGELTIGQLPEQAIIKLVSLSGRILMEIAPEKSTTRNIDIKSLANGMYMLFINGKGYQIIKE